MGDGCGEAGVRVSRVVGGIAAYGVHIDVSAVSFPANPEIAGDGLDKNDGSVDGQRANKVKKQNPTHEGFWQVLSAKGAWTFFS